MRGFFRSIRSCRTLVAFALGLVFCQPGEGAANAISNITRNLCKNETMSSSLYTLITNYKSSGSDMDVFTDVLGLGVQVMQGVRGDEGEEADKMRASLASLLRFTLTVQDIEAGSGISSSITFSEYEASCLGKLCKLHDLLSNAFGLIDPSQPVDLSTFFDGYELSLTRLEARITAEGVDDSLRGFWNSKLTRSDESIAVDEWVNNLSHHLGKLDDTDEAYVGGGWTWIGLFNNALDELRGWKLKALPAPPSAPDNTLAKSVLYSVTQVGSRGWTPTLLQAIHTAAGGGEISEEQAADVLASNTCYDIVFGKATKIADLSGSTSGGSIIAQWNYLTTLKPYKDWLTTETQDVKAAFQDVIDNFQYLPKLTKELLLQVYSYMIPTNALLSDRMNDDAIRGKLATENLSLQEYLVYLASALELDETTKTSVISNIKQRCADIVSTIKKGLSCCPNIYRGLYALTQGLNGVQNAVVRAQLRLAAATRDAPLTLAETIILDGGEETPLVLSGNFATEITECFDVGAAAAGECQDEALGPKLQALADKVKTFAATLDTAFGAQVADGELVIPSDVPVIDSLTGREVCSLVYQLMMGHAPDAAEDAAIEANTIPGLIAAITQAWSEFGQKLNAEPTLVSVRSGKRIKTLVEQLQHDMQNNRNAIEQYPKNADDIYEHLFCQTVFTEMVEVPAGDGGGVVDEGATNPETGNTEATQTEQQIDTPCKSISPQALLTAISGRDEIFTAVCNAAQKAVEYLQQLSDYETYMPTYTTLLVKIKSVETAVTDLFRMEDFASACVTNDFYSVIQGIATAVIAFPHIADTAETYVYTANLSGKAGELTTQLDAIYQVLNSYLTGRGGAILPPEEASFVFTPSGSSALWAAIDAAANGVAAAISGVVMPKTPYPAIQVLLQNIHSNLASISWNGKTHSRKKTVPVKDAAVLEMTAMQALTESIEHWNSCFDDPKCCQNWYEAWYGLKTSLEAVAELFSSAEEGDIQQPESTEQKESEPLADQVLTTVPFSIELIKDSKLVTLVDTVQAVVVSFESAAEGATPLQVVLDITAAIKTYYDALTGASLNLSPGDATDLGWCRESIKQVNALCMPLEDIIKQAINFNTAFTPTQYDADAIAAAERLEGFWNKVTSFMVDKFIPALTVDPEEASPEAGNPTPDEAATNQPEGEGPVEPDATAQAEQAGSGSGNTGSQCTGYCAVCNSVFWQGASQITMGGNIQDFLNALNTPLATAAAPFKLIKEKVKARECDSLARKLYAEQKKLEALQAGVEKWLATSSSPKEKVDALAQAILAQYPDPLDWGEADRTRLDAEIDFLLGAFDCGTVDTALELPAKTAGHALVVSLQSAIEAVLTRIKTTCKTLTTRDIEHYNTQMVLAIPRLNAALTALAPLAVMAEEGTECAECIANAAAVHKALQATLTDVQTPISAVLKNYKDPSCTRPVAKAMACLNTTFTAFVNAPHAVVAPTAEQVQALINVFNQGPICWAADLAAALEQITQIFNPDFVLANALLEDPPAQTTTMPDATTSLLTQLAALPQSINTITATVEHGDTITWIESVLKLQSTWQPLFTWLESGVFLAGCEDPIYSETAQALTKTIEATSPIRIHQDIEKSLWNLRVAIHSHHYFMPIQQAYARMERLWAKVVALSGTADLYRWAQRYARTLISGLGVWAEEPESVNDIGSFFRRFNAVLDAADLALGVAVSAPELTIEGVYGHAYLRGLIARVIDNCAALTHIIKEIGTRDCWRTNRLADAALADQLENLKACLQWRIDECASYPALGELDPVSCAFCEDDLIYADVIEAEQGVLREGINAIDLISTELRQCYGCKNRLDFLQKLAINTQKTAKIVQKMHVAVRAIDPDRIQTLIETLRPDVFEIVTPLTCLTAENALSNLIDFTNKANNALITHYLGGVAPEYEPEYAAPVDSANPCTAPVACALQIQEYLAQIVRDVDSIVYNAMAPPAGTWAPLTVDGYSLVQFMTDALTPWTSALACAQLCPTCDSTRLEEVFADFAGTITHPLQHTMAWVESQWNNYQPLAEIRACLEDLYYAHAVTAAVQRAVENESDFAQNLALVQKWTDLRKDWTKRGELGVNVPALAHFPPFALAANYTAARPQIAEVSLPVLQESWARFAADSATQYTISQTIWGRAQTVPWSCADAEACEAISQAWLDLASAIAMRRCVIAGKEWSTPPEYIKFLQGAAELWRLIPNRFTLPEPCCIDLADQFRQTALAVQGIEYATEQLLKLGSSTPLDRLDFTEPIVHLKTLMQAASAMARTQRPCDEVGDLARLSATASLLRAALQHVVEEAGGITIDAEPSINTPEGTPCTSILAYAQQIAYSLARTEAAISRLYEQLMVAHNAYLPPRMYTDFLAFSKELPPLADAIMQLPAHWICPGALMHARLAYAQTDSAALHNIALLNQALYDEESRRCCLIRKDAIIATNARVHRVLLSVAQALANPAQHMETDAPLGQKLAKTAPILDAHRTALAGWIQAPVHTDYDASPMAAFLTALEAIWPSNTATWDFDLASGCETVAGYWRAIAEDLASLTSSINQLALGEFGPQLLGDRNTYYAAERLAAFFQWVASQCAAATVDCVNCPSLLPVFAAPRCIEVADSFLGWLCVPKSCCDVRIQDLEIAACWAVRVDELLTYVATQARITAITSTSLTQIFTEANFPMEGSVTERLSAASSFLERFVQAFGGTISSTSFTASLPDCANAAAYAQRYQAALAHIQQVIENMATYYEARESAVSTTVSSALLDLAGWATFLLEKPVELSCDSCMDPGCDVDIEGCNLSEGIERVSAALKNRCCAAETGLVSQLETLSDQTLRLFGALRGSDLASFLADSTQSAQWQKLDQQMRAVYTRTQAEDAILEAHPFGEEDDAKDTCFLSEFTALLQNAMGVLQECCPIALTHAPERMEGGRDCVDKFNYLRMIGKQLYALDAEIVRVAAELRAAETPYPCNVAAISAVRSLRLAMSAIREKVIDCTQDACISCTPYVQMESINQMLDPGLANLASSLEQLEISLLHNSCCEQISLPLFDWLAQVNQLAHTATALGKIWMQRERPSLTTSPIFMQQLTEIKNAMERTYTIISSNEAFEDILQKILNENLMGQAEQALQSLHRAYTGTEAERLPSNRDYFLQVEPCNRLVAVLAAAAEQFVSVREALEIVISFWETYPPECSAAARRQLRAIASIAQDFEKFLPQFLSGNYGHFSHCITCALPSTVEIRRFTDATNSNALVNIADHVEQFLCAEESKQRAKLLESLRYLEHSVNGCVNAPISEVNIDFSNLDPRLGEVAINITNTTALNPFLQAVLSSMQGLADYCTPNVGLFAEAAGGTPNMMTCIVEAIDKLASSISTEYEKLGGTYSSPKELVTEAVHSCATNRAYMDEISTTLNSIFSIAQRAGEWYQQQTFADNGLVRLIAATARQLANHALAVLAEPGTCANCSEAWNEQHAGLTLGFRGFLDGLDAFDQALLAPKCRQIFADQLQKVDQALDLCAQQFQTCFPWFNVDAPERYVVVELVARTADIRMALEKLAQDLSASITTLTTYSNDKLLCVTAAAPVVACLEPIVADITNLQGTVHKLADINHSGVLLLTASSQQTEDWSQYSTAARVETLYARILTHMSDITTCLEAVNRALQPVKDSQQPFEYTEIAVMAVQELGQAFKLVVEPFNTCIAASAVLCNQTPQACSYPLIGVMAQLCEKNVDICLDMQITLKDRLWSQLVPDLLAFGSNIFPIENALSFIAQNVKDVGDLTSEGANGLCLPLQGIIVAVHASLSAFPDVVSTDNQTRIQAYRAQLVDFSTEAAQSGLTDLINELQIGSPGNMEPYEPSEAFSYREQCYDNIDAICTSLRAQDQALLTMQQLSIDEAGNDAVKLLIQDVSKELSFLGARFQVVFDQLFEALEEETVSVVLANEAPEEAAGAEESRAPGTEMQQIMQDICARTLVLSSMFDSKNCCRGLASAYWEVATETQELRTRIRSLASARVFHVSKLFNADTVAAVQEIESSVREIYQMIFSPTSTVLADCYASKVKNYVRAKDSDAPDASGIVAALRRMGAGIIGSDTSIVPPQRPGEEGGFCAVLSQAHVQLVALIDALATDIADLVKFARSCGIAPGADVSHISSLVSAFRNVEELLSNIWLSSRHTCKKCTFGQDKEFLGGLVQSVRSVFLSLGTIQTVVESFCCPVGIVPALRQIDTAMHAWVQQLEDLCVSTENSVSNMPKPLLRRTYRFFKQASGIVSELRPILQIYFSSPLHSSSQQEALTAIAGIFEQIPHDIRNAIPFFPFDRTAAGHYLQDVQLTVAVFPTLFVRLQQSLATKEYALYTDLAEQFAWLPAALEAMAQGFVAAPAECSLWHNQETARRFYDALACTLRACSDGARWLHKQACHSTKERAVRAALYNINNELCYSFNVLHALEDHVRADIGFGLGATRLAWALDNAQKAIPQCKDVRSAWKAIEKQNPVISFDALVGALEQEREQFHRVGDSLLQCARLLSGNDALVVQPRLAVSVDANASIELLLAYARIHMESIGLQIDRLCNAITTATPRRFHAAVVACVQSILPQQLLRWVKECQWAMWAFHGSPNETYPCKAIATMLRSMCDQAQHFAITVTELGDQLAHTGFSMEAAFRSEVAARIEQVVSTLQCAGGSSLDDAERLFAELPPLLTSLVGQTAARPAPHTQEEEAWRLAYLQSLDALSAGIQKVFNVHTMLRPQVYPNMDAAALADATRRIEESISSGISVFKLLQANWLRPAYPLREGCLWNIQKVQGQLLQLAPAGVGDMHAVLAQFSHQLGQPTCCNAATALLQNITANIVQSSACLHAVATRKVAPLGADDYAYLIKYLQFVMQQIHNPDSADAPGLVQCLLGASSMGCLDANYLNMLQRCADATSRLQLYSTNVASLFGADAPVEENVLEPIEKSAAINRIRTACERICADLRSFVVVWSPEIGEVPPFRAELIAFMRQMAVPAVRSLNTALQAYTKNYEGRASCPSCSAELERISIIELANACQMWPPYLEEIAAWAEEAEFSPLAQQVHQLRTCVQQIAAQTRALAEHSPIALDAVCEEALSSIHTEFDGVRTQWSATMAELSESSTQTARLAALSSWLTGLMPVYEAWEVQISGLCVHNGLAVLVPVCPDPLYTKETLYATCTYLAALQADIGLHTNYLSERTIHQRVQNATAATFAKAAQRFVLGLNQLWVEEGRALGGLERTLFAAILPDAAIASALDPLIFTFAHSPCCAPYRQQIADFSGHTTALYNQLEEFISIAPFIQLESDAHASAIIQCLSDCSQSQPALLQVLQQLAIPLEFIVDRLRQESDSPCFALPDEGGILLQALRAADSKIVQAKTVLSQISALCQTGTSAKLSLADLAERIRHTNIYYDEALAASWGRINSALGPVENYVHTLRALLSKPNALCAFEADDSTMRASLIQVDTICSQFDFYSHQALEAYQQRCCSMLAHELRAIAHYTRAFNAPVSGMLFEPQSIDKTRQRLQQLGAILQDIVQKAHLTAESGIHTRGKLEFLHQIQAYLIRTHQLLNGSTPPVFANNAIETCDSVALHLDQIADDLAAGPASLYTVLTQWVEETAKAQDAEDKEVRCFDVASLNAAEFIRSMLSNFSAHFKHLSAVYAAATPCAGCKSAEAILKISDACQKLTEPFIALSEHLNAPTCCTQRALQIANVLAYTRQLTGYLAPAAIGPLLEQLTDPARAGASMQLITSGLNAACSEIAHWVVSPPFALAACNSSSLVANEAYFIQHCTAALRHCSATLHSLTSAGVFLEPVAEQLPPMVDMCAGLLQLSQELHAQIKLLCANLGAIEEAVGLLTSPIYQDAYVDAFTATGQAMLLLQAHIQSSALCCSGCERFATTSGTTTNAVREAYAADLIPSLHIWERLTAHARQRWSSAQAIALHALVSRAAEHASLFEQMMQLPMEEPSKSSAQSVQQWLYGLVQTYDALNEALPSVPCSWHDIDATAALLTNLASILERGTAHLTASLGLSLPPSQLTAPSAYDFYLVQEDAKNLMAIIGKEQAAIRTRPAILFSAHNGALGAWRLVAQAVRRLAKATPSVIERDCVPCNSLPLEAMANSLRALADEADSFIWRLHQIDCCAPIRTALQQFANPLYTIGSAIFFFRQQIAPLEQLNLAFCNSPVSAIEKLAAVITDLPNWHGNLSELLCGGSRIDWTAAHEALTAIASTVLTNIAAYVPSLAQITQPPQNYLKYVAILDLEQSIQLLKELTRWISEEIAAVWPAIDQRPVVDLDPAFLTDFQAMQSALRQVQRVLGPEATPAIGCVINACHRYDRLVNRTAFADIDATLRTALSNLCATGPESVYAKLETYCCSPLVYCTYDVLCAADSIDQHLRYLAAGGHARLSDFLLDEKIESAAEELNTFFVDNRLDFWTIPCAPSGTTLPAGVCEASCAEGTLLLWKTFLEEMLDAFSKHTQQSYPSTFKRPQLYRCQAFTNAVGCAEVVCEHMQQTFEQIASAIRNHTFSYHSVFPMCNLLWNGKNSLGHSSGASLPQSLQSFIGSLQGLGRQLCGHCPTISSLFTTGTPSLPVQLHLINTTAAMDKIIATLSADCDRGPIAFIEQRTSLINQLASLVDVWSEDTDNFWFIVETLDLNSVCVSCRKIGSTLSTLLTIPPHDSLCQMPRSYELEQSMAQDLSAILTKLSISATALAPTTSSLAFSSLDSCADYAASRCAFVYGLAGFADKLSALLACLREEHRTTSSKAFISAVGFVRTCLEELSTAERALFDYWRTSPICFRCPPDSGVDPDDHALVPTDTLSSLAYASQKLAILAANVQTFGVGLVTDCCYNAFQSLFHIPEETFRLNNLLSAFCDVATGAENQWADLTFSAYFEIVGKLLERLGGKLENVLTARTIAQEKTDICAIPDLTEVFSALYAGFAEINADLTAQNEALELTPVADYTWNSEDAVCYALPLSMQQTAEFIGDIINTFFVFTKKMQSSNARNRRAVEVFTHTLYSAIDNVKHVLGSLKIANKPLCGNCSKDSINEGIESIITALALWQEKALALGAVFSEQSCCVPLMLTCEQTVGAINLAAALMHEQAETLSQSRQEGATDEIIAQAESLRLNMRAAPLDLFCSAISAITERLVECAQARGLCGETNAFTPCTSTQVEPAFVALNSVLLNDLATALTGSSWTLTRRDEGDIVEFQCGDVGKLIANGAAAFDTLASSVKAITEDFLACGLPLHSHQTQQALHSMVRLLPQLEQALNSYLSGMKARVICRNCSSSMLTNAVSAMIHNQKQITLAINSLCSTIAEQCCNPIACALRDVAEEIGFMGQEFAALSEVRYYPALPTNLLLPQAVQQQFMLLSDQFSSITRLFTPYLSEWDRLSAAGMGSDQFSLSEPLLALHVDFLQGMRQHIQVISEQLRSITQHVLAMDATYAEAVQARRCDFIAPTVNVLRHTYLNEAMPFVFASLQLSCASLDHIANHLIRSLPSNLGASASDHVERLRINMETIATFLNQVDSRLPTEHLRMFGVQYPAYASAPTQYALRTSGQRLSLIRNVPLHCVDYFRSLDLWRNQAIATAKNLRECIWQTWSDSVWNLPVYSAGVERVLSQLGSLSHTISEWTELKGAETPVDCAPISAAFAGLYRGSVELCAASGSACAEPGPVLPPYTCSCALFSWNRFTHALEELHRALCEFADCTPFLHARLNFSIATDDLRALDNETIRLPLTLQRITPQKLCGCAACSAAGGQIGAAAAIAEMNAFAESLPEIVTSLTHSNSAGEICRIRQNLADASEVVYEGRSETVLSALFKPVYDPDGRPRATADGNVIAAADAFIHAVGITHRRAEWLGQLLFTPAEQAAVVSQPQEWTAHRDQCATRLDLPTTPVLQESPGSETNP